jgi:divalent metal cation (Fe/Co/Zn/Cd) transporter
LLSAELKGGKSMMEGPWLGLGIMVVMTVALIWWLLWAMRKGKKE